MCLNHDLYFFWVSSLAYPNLLGKKGYVVVVVVDKLHKEKYIIRVWMKVAPNYFLSRGDCSSFRFFWKPRPSK